MIGSIWVGVVGSRSTGCILMGPVVSDCGVLLGMTVNAQPAFSFEGDGRAIPSGASLQVCGRLALLPHEGSGLLAFGRALVLRFLFRQQLQKDPAPLRIGRVGKQPSIEPDVLIVDELFHFPALRSGRHRHTFSFSQEDVHFRT